MVLEAAQNFIYQHERKLTYADQGLRFGTLATMLISPYLSEGSKLFRIAQTVSTTRAAIWTALLLRRSHAVYAEKGLERKDKDGKQTSYTRTFKERGNAPLGEIAGLVTAALFATYGAGAAGSYFAPNSKIASTLLNTSGAALPFVVAVWSIDDLAEPTHRVYAASRDETKKANQIAFKAPKFTTLEKIGVAGAGFELLCQAFGAGWIRVPNALKASQLMGLGAASCGLAGLWKSA